MKVRFTGVQVCLSMFALLTSACFAEETEVQKYFDEDAGVYVINVSGEYKITYADVMAAGSNPIAKRGPGTLEVGGAMASFTGEIRIEEGVYTATKAESLGTSAGGTVVSNGATLKIACTTENAAQFDDKLWLAGTVVNSSGTDHPYAFQGSVELLGDAVMRGQTLGIQNSGLTMNGYKLTVEMYSSSVMKFENVEITSPGNIDLLQGRLHLEGDAQWEGDENNRLAISSGAMLGMREALSDIRWTLDLADGSVLYPSLGGINEFSGNVWSGPVVLNGTCQVLYNDGTSGTYVRLDGPVTGNGAFTVGTGAWLVLSNPENSFTGGVEVSQGSDGDGGLVLAANGALPADGGKLVIKSGTVRLSSQERYDLPFIEVTSGGRLCADYRGFGGTVAKLTKWGANSFDFDAGLTVTGETYVAKSLLRISPAPLGTAGLLAAHTNFADQAAWEEFVGGVAQGSTPSEKKLAYAFERLLEIAQEDGFAVTVASPEAAYREWAASEKFLMGAYSGYIWNNSPEDRVVTFASSIADTAVLWINGAKVLMGVASKPDNDGKTHFVNIGECVLKPGANSFRFLLGHRKTGSYGPRSDTRDGSLVYWEAKNGLMYRDGSYGTPDVLSSRDFGRLEDSGDGMLFTVTKDASEDRIRLNEALYRPCFDKLRFDRDAVRCTMDLGGAGMFPQNGFEGCPRITNGTMCVTGVWSFVAKDIARHPMEVASGAGVVFDGATLSASVADYPRGETGTVILRAEAGASVTGLPSVKAADSGIAVWEIKRERRDGDLCLVLCGRLRGTVVSFR